MTRTNFALAALIGAASAQNSEFFRQLPNGDDYIYHYPNNLKYAFADLSASFPEHPDYLVDESTAVKADQISPVLDTLCGEAKFNGLKTTMHYEYDDDASENLRRSIYNHARSSDDDCDNKHMMMFASAPDYYDMLAEDFAGDLDAYVTFLADYQFAYWPEFMSPLTGVTLSYDDMMDLMDKLDTELETRTHAYMLANGNLNPVPFQYRYGTGNRPSWSMNLLAGDRRRELSEGSPRDSVRRLSALQEAPNAFVADQGRELYTGAPTCDINLAENTIDARSLFAGIDVGDGATTGVKGAFAFGWFFNLNGVPSGSCDGITGARITGANNSQMVQAAPEDLGTDGDRAAVLFDNTHASHNSLQTTFAQTWAVIDLTAANCAAYDPNGLGGENACFLLDREADPTTNDNGKPKRYIQIEFELFDGTTYSFLNPAKKFAYTTLVDSTETDIKTGSPANRNLMASFENDLLTQLAADSYPFSDWSPSKIFQPWDDLVSVTPHTRTNVEVSWNAAATHAGLTYLRQFLFVKDYIWYADYVDDQTNMTADKHWNSELSTTDALATRTHVINTQDFPSQGWANNGLTQDVVHPSSWCTVADDSTCAKTDPHPFKEIIGEEVYAYVAGIFQSEQYFEKMPNSIFIADPPTPPQNIVTKNDNNYFYRDAADYTIEWDAPADSGGIPITNYKIFYWNADTLDVGSTESNENAPFGQTNGPTTTFTMNAATLTDFPKGMNIGYRVCSETDRGFTRDDQNCAESGFFRTQVPAASTAPTGTQDGSIGAGWDDTVTFTLQRHTDDSEDAGFTAISHYELELYKLARDEVLGTDTPTKMFGPIQVTEQAAQTTRTIQFIDGSNTFGAVTQATDLVYGEQYFLKYAQCNAAGTDFEDQVTTTCHMDLNEVTVFTGYNAFFLYANVPDPVTALAKVTASVASGIEMSWTAPAEDNGDDITSYNMRMTTGGETATEGTNSYTIVCSDPTSCTIKDETRAISVPVVDVNYDVEVQACNSKGCSTWEKVSNILIPGSNPDPPTPANPWLIANNYQISIAIKQPANVGTGAVTEYEAWWDQGDPAILEPEDFTKAFKTGVAASSYSLLAADFAANGFTDTADGDTEYLIYTMFITSATASERLDRTKEYCFRFKTVTDAPATSEFSAPTCSTITRFRVTQLVGPDFLNLGNQNPNTVRQTQKWLEQEDTEAADLIDFTEVFDRLGAYSEWGDQSSREANFEEIIDYGNDNTVSLDVFNTMTSGEWYRSTGTKGRWAIDLESTDCAYPEEDDDGGRMLANDNSNNPNIPDGTNPGNKDNTWRSSDQKPMPSLTEAIDAGVRAIAPRLAVPRFVNATTAVITCRTAEWLNGGWAQADDDTFNARSTKTRNHNKCGNGSNKHGKGKATGRDDQENVNGPLCPYERYTAVAGATTAASRWEPECVQVGDGIATVTLDTYRPCTKTIEVPSVEETGFNSVVFTATFEKGEAFVEECLPDGTCFYEEIKSGEAYTFTESEGTNVNLVLENNNSNYNTFQVAYDYQFIDAAGSQLNGDIESLTRPTGAVSCLMTSIFAVVASLSVFLF